MIECASCYRLYPEVTGAPTQVCPHCAHEMETPIASPGGSVRPGAGKVDPVGAIAFAGKLGSREYPRLLLLWLPVLVTELAVTLAIAAYQTSAGLPADVDALTTGQAMQFLGVALPLYLVLFTVQFAIWVFVSARVLDAALGGTRLRDWRALARPALAAGVVLSLTYAAGFVMLIVGFFVFLHWFLFAPAELAAGARGVGEAFDRSRKFARERRTLGFTAFIVLVGALQLVPVYAAEQAASPWQLVLPAFVAWLVGPIIPLLAASYIALAMRSPEAGQTSGSLAPRRDTTRCPRCGTLIPYTPTGSAVDVVCPSCGTAGRVL